MVGRVYVNDFIFVWPYFAGKIKNNRWLKSNYFITNVISRVSYVETTKKFKLLKIIHFWEALFGRQADVLINNCNAFILIMYITFLSTPV